MVPLSMVKSGRYRIVKIAPECSGAKKRLTALGIFVNDEIEVTKPSPGPVIFKKDEMRIGIGHGIALHIFVSPRNSPEEKKE